MPESPSQSTPLIGNLQAAFDFMQENIPCCKLYSANFPTYQIPPDQYQKICLVVTKMKGYTGRGTEKIEIPLFEIPILDLKLKGHNPTFLIGGWLAFEDGELIGYSYLVSVVFLTESDHQQKYAKHGKRNINAQSCCLHNRPNTKRIVRKIHFDYDQTLEEIELKKHMQIGGKFPEHHLSDLAHANFHFCSEHYLEEPRIPIPPYDFVLLLDLMIRQFHTPFDEWKNEGDWRKIVEESRRIVSGLN